MLDQTALAYVNLNALLRNMEDLVALDAEAAMLVKGCKETVAFVVKSGPTGFLTFGPDGCHFYGSSGLRPRTSIGLFFSNPAALNAMVAGTGNPIPYKGLTRLGFLEKNFSMLAKRLETVLKAKGTFLTDSGLASVNAELLLYAAAFAVAELANHDPVGKLNAARIPDGIIELGVAGGPAVSLESKGGVMKATKGRSGKARSCMTFATLEGARSLFSGEVDAMAALGEGTVAMSGYIPMLEHMNKVLGLVPRYLG